MHLRSAANVTGYYIEATDGDIGHVEDFIIDDETWEIRYMVVDTRNWLPGKKVLIAPRWIDRVSWEVSKVYASLSRDAIKKAPEYHPDTLNREYEEKLHDHYDRPKYWDHPVAVLKAPQTLPGFKELIEKKSEIPSGPSYWDAVSAKLSIPRQLPSIGITPDCFGVSFGVANNQIGVAA